MKCKVPDFLNDGVVESDKYSGFYILPTNQHIAISFTGNVVSLQTGRELKPCIKNHGYLAISFSIKIVSGVKETQFLMHRLFALAFLRKPDNLIAFSFQKLQVNHIDGNKLNNDLSNLEWCRPKDNMRHAFKNKIIDIGKSVLAKNILTGEVRKFNTIRECAEYYDISQSSLKRHLDSKDVGKVTKDWTVFKLDDNSFWPILDINDQVENKWFFVGLTIAKNCETNIICLFNTMKEACSLLNLDYDICCWWRRKYGVKEPYKGWLFENIDSVMGYDIGNLKPNRVLIGRKDSRIFKITNMDNDTSEVITGTKEAAKYVDISRGAFIDKIRISEGKSVRFDNFIVETSQNQLAEVVLPKV